MHFIPTNNSWPNLIERWFRDLTDKQIRRGTLKSVRQLIETLTTYIESHNADVGPLVRTAKADDILAKTRRARAALDMTRHQ